MFTPKSVKQLHKQTPPHSHTHYKILNFKTYNEQMLKKTAEILNFWFAIHFLKFLNILLLQTIFQTFLSNNFIIITSLL